MRRLLVLLQLLACICLTVPAQQRNSRQQTKATQQRRGTQPKAQQQKPAQKKATPQKKKQPTETERLQQQKQQAARQREAYQKRQHELEKQVRQRMQDVEALTSDIDDNRLTLDSLRLGIDSLNRDIHRLDSQLAVLQSELEERRQHYIKSVRYMYRNRRVQSQMMFVLSASNLNQVYRRLRFMNEYTTYQRAQGEAVKQKSEQVSAKRDELQQSRTLLGAALDKSRQQQQQMEERQAEQQRMVASLQKEQQTVKRLITQQQQQEEELNRRIEKLIAEELEKARKAEEERQRQLAEQRRREQEQRARQQAKSKTPAKPAKPTRPTTTPAKPAKPATTPSYRDADPDRKLTGGFGNNKGRLPVPITGKYRIIRNFGNYTLAGVTLKSSSVHLEGQAGAQARCVYDGEVSSVVQPTGSIGGTAVMVRHGRYISVYSNLATVSVKMGDKVKTNQALGTVGAGNVLVFRLQYWNEVLNPKLWIKRL